MGADAAVWASIRRAHEDTTERATDFCRRHGVSTSAYYRRRRRECWPSRPNSAARSSQSLQTPQLLEEQNASDEPLRPTRKRLAKRLYAAIDQELQQLETGACSADPMSVADVERRTRTLMNMIRGLEKVLELEADKQKQKNQRAKRKGASGRGSSSRTANDGQTPSDDAERMRQEIAERLERLHAQWADQPGSEGPESGSS